MVTFDHVLPLVVRTCEEHPGFAGIERATVVRDLRGHVRLALRPAAGAKVDITALEASLAAALGSWFARPILGPKASPGLARLRGLVLDTSEPWDTSWVDDAGTTHVPPPGKWHRIERHLSKLDWMGSEKAKPPWALVAQRPAIITFFSFKGGVGRTTLLASTAWQLAKEGKRVVAIDLDVEAPGLAALLGGQSERGVIDFLVDHAAVGAVDLSDLVAPATQLGTEAALVDVISAGTIDHDYFEKLARLDFVGSLVDASGARPVRDALRALLDGLMKRDPMPDYILLDSRAGLHDLAGLSLHDLGHVDVLVGRDSDQAYRGLELTVEVLGRRRAPSDLRCAVVQTMAPADPGSDEYKRITAEYRKRSYEAFVEHVYVHDEGDDPDINAEDVAHSPSVVLFQSRLLNFSSLASRREELLSADFAGVKARIVELCIPEEAGE